MPLHVGLALVAVLMGAGAQSMTGIGFSLISVPLLTIAFGGNDGVRFANAFAIGLNALQLLRGWRAADPGGVVRLLIPATLVAPLAAWAVSTADVRTLAVVNGVLVLVAVAALASGLRIQRLVGAPGAMIAGAVSGAMNVVGGVGGPAAAIYALNAGWSHERMRSTLAACFLGINIVSVLSRGIPRSSGLFLMASGAALLAGFGAGAATAERLDTRTVRAGVLVVAAAGALAAIVQGLR